jgi:hypothetical protein
MADPANKDLIAVGDQLQTGYVTMNVTQSFGLVGGLL